MMLEYPLPAQPGGIARGPDGNLWITEPAANRIAKITTSGAVTEYAVPTAGASPWEIVAGPDGNLWFTEPLASNIGRITPSGAITEYPIPGQSPAAWSITAGPDGNLWFLDNMGIAKTTPSGAMTQFSHGSVIEGESEIVAGPDGNLWFTDSLADKVARITPSGSITDYPLMTPQPNGVQLNPTSIAAGPDGNLWVVAGGALWRVTTAGSAVEFFTPAPAGIAAGPDGNIWFTSAGKIVKLAPAGTYTQYPLPAAGAQGGAITAGPDGNIWFTEPGNNRIAKLVVATVPADTLLGLSASSLSFTAPATGAPPPAQTLSITAPAGAAYTAAAGVIYAIGAPWLKISPFGNLTGSQILSVTVNQAYFGAYGDYLGNILLTSGNVTQIVLVTMHLTQPTVNENVIVSPGSLSFTYTQGGAAPTPQSITAKDMDPAAGAIPLTITTSVQSPAGGKWLSLTNADGTPLTGGTGATSGNAILVHADPTGLAPGTYTAQISVTPVGGNVDYVSVYLTVNASAVVTANPASLSFVWQTGTATPLPQSVQVSATSTTQPFSVANDSPAWLRVLQPTIFAPAPISVSVAPVGLAVGTYTGTLTITMPPSTASAKVTVTLTVLPAPTAVVTVSPQSLVFSVTGAVPAPQQNLTVSNSGNGSAFVTAAGTVVTPAGGSWLMVMAGSGTLPAATGGTPGTFSIPVAVDQAGLTPGSFTATITITAGSTVLKVPVTLNVAAASTALTVVPLSLAFNYIANGSLPPAQTVQVTASGPAVPFTVTTDGSAWLSVSPLSSNAPASLTVRIARSGLDPGVYSGSFLIKASGTTAQVLVSLVVKPPSPVQEFTLTQANAQPQYITLGPDGNIWFTEFSAGQVGKITPAGTVTEYPLSANSRPTGITLGPDGYLWIAEYIPARIARMNAAGAFNEYTIPTPLAEPWEIAAGPDGNLWFTESNASKIGRITPAGVITEYPLAANSQPEGIAAGPDGNVWFTEAYTDRIGKITPDGTITEYPLPHTGSLPAEITTGPDGNLWVTEGPGVAKITPGGQITEYSNSKTGGAVGITAGPDGNVWFISADSGSVASITTAGLISTYPLPLNYSGPFGIAPGADGNIWFTEAAGRIGRLPLTNSMAVTGIVNSASFAAAPVAPGEIVTIAGTALGPAAPVGLTLDASGKVATSGGGVTVSFNGHPAPLVYAGASQINCVAPYEIAGATNVLVRASFAGLFSSFSLHAAASAPGVFTADGSGTGAAAAFNSDGSYNGPDNPAAAGSTIAFYLTGEGQTNPPGVTGAVTAVNTAGGPVTPQPVIAPAVTVGGVPAAVAFYGEAPGLVSGVLQMNIQIPSGLPPGGVSLVVSFGPAQTQRGVVVFVK